MSNPLFSSYSKGENRITSTLIAVFERINSFVVEFILKNLLEDANIELVRYINQPRNFHGKSVPDALIAASFEYYLETKIKANSLRTEQLQSHLNYLSKNGKDSRLIIITPDNSEPRLIQELNNDRVYWCNFEKLRESVESCLFNQDLILSEREKYLLNELIKLIETEKGLLSDIPPAKKVLVVPAREAINEYENYAAYICQPDRKFQEVNYIAFYYHNRIDKRIPKILGYIDNINLSKRDPVDSEIIIVSGDLTDVKNRFQSLKDILKKEGLPYYKILILTQEDDERTIKLEKEIPNDKRSESGRLTAFVQNQRYISLDKLMKATKTTDLES